jgi:hypothetical protein
MTTYNSTLHLLPSFSIPLLAHIPTPLESHRYVHPDKVEVDTSSRRDKLDLEVSPLPFPLTMGLTPSYETAGEASLILPALG